MLKFNPNFNEKSHGIVTNSADGVHFVACKGRVQMDHCIFEGMIDDALNIHSNFYSAVSASGNTLVAARSQASHALNAYSQVFHAGDTVAVYNNAKYGVDGNMKTALNYLNGVITQIDGKFSLDFA